MRHSYSGKKNLLGWFFAVLSILGYGFIVFAAAPSGGYYPGANSPSGTLDPDCTPGSTDCFVRADLDWSKVGNAGTDGGTLNFIGTTDAQDFVIKTNSIEIGRFGQVGNIALGSEDVGNSFATPLASGDYAFAVGPGAIASEDYAIAIGPSAISSGLGSVAIGSGAQATSLGSIALGNGIASGSFGSVSLGGAALSPGPTVFSPTGSPEAAGPGSLVFGGGAYAHANAGVSVVMGQNDAAYGVGNTVFGVGNRAFSYAEFSAGIASTEYVPNSISVLDSDDRLFNVGNGTGVGFESDAFTILKNGDTGIGIDNFEANTNGNPFQVGDGTTNIIGYVDGGTGAWVAVSDARKKHDIASLSYGLDTVNQLKPVSFKYNRNDEETIGFLAQDVKDVIPEAVFGNEKEGYGMAYQTLTPVLVQAIQELDLKISNITTASNTVIVPSGISLESIKGWLGDMGNGISDIYAEVFHARKIQTDELCVGGVCVTEEQFMNVFGNQNPVTTTTPEPDVPDDTPPDTGDAPSDTTDAPTDTPPLTDTPITP